MIKTLFSATVLLIALSHSAIAQRIAPAPAQEKPIVIVGGTVHVGNGTVIENGMIRIENGKITTVGSAGAFQANDPNVTMIQAQGKQIYPGIIVSNSELGLN